jgi:putative FmdB family regulatory protein
VPLYEYRCTDCGHRFERIQKFSDPLVTTCPQCGGEVEHLLSPSAVQFKGSGWYVTDYARKSTGATTTSSDSGSGEKSAKTGEGKPDSKKSEPPSPEKKS